MSWTSRGRAEPNQEAVRFQYSAPSTCPDAASFTARVRERTSLGRPAEVGELARTFNVEVLGEEPGFLGSVEFVDDGGSKVSRRVHGEQCDAVVNSLALITALALDATLRSESEPEPPALPRPAPVQASPVALAAPATAAVTPHPAERVLRGARIGVSGDYDGAISALPFALLGQLDWRNGWSLRLSMQYALRDFLVDDQRRARLQRLGIEGGVCPRRFESGAFALTPCLDLAVGSLQAQGLPGGKLTTAGGATIFWAELGAELRAAWEPDAPFWVELHGSLGLPLVAHTFKFTNPEQKVYEIPRLAGSVGLATGVRF